MDAIKLLKLQHREVESLFEEFANAGERANKRREQLCREISDALAVHAAIEEKIFYPATKDSRTEDMLREAVEEHLSAKRFIADLTTASADDEQFEAKMNVLKEQIEHHVEEEEKDLFPKVQKFLDSDRLQALGAEMEKMAEELKAADEPRMSVPGETDHAAPI